MNIPATMSVSELAMATEFLRDEVSSMGWTPRTISSMAIRMRMESPNIYYLRIFYLKTYMAAFTYLDPTQAFLELTMGSLAPIPQDGPQIKIETIPCELDESWKNFEQELGKFKREFAKVKRDLGIKTNEVEKIHQSTEIGKMLAERINSDDLKAKILSIIDSYESEEGIHALTQQCGELKGQYEEMGKVLQNTNAERYAKFICFVCMDRSIDLFFDPCGHVICEQCWRNTRDKRICPGCRGTLHDTKKIFTI
jgi:archaellum component FlaC